MNKAFQQTWTAWAVVIGLATLGCTSDSGTSDSGVVTPGVVETVPDLEIEEEFTQTAYNSVNIIWVLDPEWDEAIDPHVDELQTAFYEQLLLHGVPWRVAIMSPLTSPA
ncbi:MAG: hypothetical protein AAGA48_35400, partial [Myxococcota bacterium]